MTAFHIPERYDGSSTLRTKACFIPDGRDFNNSLGKSAVNVLDTFGFRTVGKVIADSQLQGSAAQQINVINYTDDHIVLLDKWNRISIVPPVSSYDLGRERYYGSILVEIVNSKASQTADIGSKAYRRYKNVQLLQKGEIGGYFYKEPTREESPKWQGNQIHQFSIGDAIAVLHEAGGSMYCPNTDLVFMTLDAAESGELVLHPNTDVSTLAALELEEDNSRVITHQVSVNNMKAQTVYVNIAGDVMSVPNTRDPNKKTGIYIRRLENRRGQRSRIVYDEFFEFGDPSCPLNVFESENAAITNGHPDRIVDLEIAKTKLLTEQQKATNAKEAQDFAKVKSENDKELEAKRLADEKAIAEKERLKRQAEADAARARAEADKEKTQQQQSENKQAHRSRMLEIGGKLALAIASVVSAGLTVMKLMKI